MIRSASLHADLCSALCRYIWSPDKKFRTWRELWLALATAEKELGLEITDEQLAEMAAHLEDINYDVAAAKEKELRHDVMGHIHAFGAQCPAAMPIIHLGATSCYVADNTELIQIRESLKLIKHKLVHLIDNLRTFADDNKDMPTLGFTHYQPAQLVTVGKRASLWLQDFLFDYHAIAAEIDWLPFRGVKGTTGTQASFMELFDGDGEKIRQLDEKVTTRMGFSRSISVSGQTYTRKIDYRVVSLLSGIAQSAMKMATDIRLLSNLKEIEEPFESSQVGSSAMAYKRNPMRSERICSLSRFVMSLVANTAQTHSSQWFERTLDDSANRRIVLPEAALATDVVLTLANNVVSGLKIWPKVIEARVMQELPFMATEVILMACVKAGGDRQDLHEAVRELSMQSAKVVKEEGKPNDLLERIAGDARFAAVHDKLHELMKPELFIGRSSEQVSEFLAADVDPLLQSPECQELLNVDSKDDVGV